MKWRVIFTMNNTTYVLKGNEIERKWYIIDAANKPLGRVATEAARLLARKHKPIYTKNLDTGDHVIVINCKGVQIVKKKFLKVNLLPIVLSV